MALTAWYGPGQQVADLTLPDLGVGCSFADLYRMRPRPDLRCRYCGYRMHLKISPRGLRFFAHDANADCVGTGESAEHQELKILCARWSRECGWRAEPEQAGPDWRADVLATAADGRRIAWEIQVSPQHADDAAQRSARYRRDGITCVWIALGAPGTDWFRPRGALVTSLTCSAAGARTWMVTEGCRKHHLERGAFTEHGHWSDVPPLPLDTIARSILRGQLVQSAAAEGQPWWWVRADERADALRLGDLDSPEQLARRSRLRERQTALHSAAAAAAANRWPWLDLKRQLFRARLTEQRDATMFGEPVTILFGGNVGFRLFAVLLPDLIADDEQTVPVLADTAEAAAAIGARYPQTPVAVPQGPPPWPLYRYRNGTKYPAWQFGETAEQSRTRPAYRNSFTSHRRPIGR
ncbi:competence protein CoiA [Amycolatopsis australiensis]|uniref:Competence protein CoiA-like family protein n=1 Tax=Amycolatopsis australiensis TaxID=546364 RepID=A0A1K1LM58_9PSEU|nr:competence protein CoiA family protein [Amycolatopsis australiensis]SFW11939.1 Competence protein CoiA-like family protein [Amycolatopsis australiensis]